MATEEVPPTPKEIYTSLVEMLYELGDSMRNAPPEPDLKVLIQLNQALTDLATATTSLTSYILEGKLEE